MITAINKICGIGRYAHYEGPMAIHKNQIIFGFNGTGKSTMSDIFYSLSDEEHTALLVKRKTLCKVDGTEPEDMEISFETETGELTYQDGHWSQKQNVLVFNDQYMDDYVFVESGHELDGASVVFGKAGTQLAKRKEEYQREFDDKLEIINNTITTHKELCGKLGFGKTKIKNGWEKRISKIAEQKLYTVSEQHKVEEALGNITAFNEKNKSLEEWNNRLKCGLRFLESNETSNIKHLEKELKNIPKVTNKEISEHIAHYMTHTDMNWLTRGMSYQADANHCPFCGQEIKGQGYKKLSIQLEKFISSRQKQKADAITASMQRLASFFDEKILEKVFVALASIKEENEVSRILHKKTLTLLENMQLIYTVTPGCFHSLNEKIMQKAANPHVKIELTEDEKSICLSLVQVIQKFERLYSALEEERKKVQDEIKKTSEYEKSAALYEASFGTSCDGFKQMKQFAKNLIDIDKKIQECQKEIDTLFEKKRLEGINSFLQELNVNFRVRLQNGKYCVQIIGYVPTEYDKKDKILCSEGERRMLALAYFLQELMLSTGKKIVVVDDPISSLDMSRKSVVAFKIVELMKDNDSQVIVLSHDISFVEKIQSLITSAIPDVDMLELCKNNVSPFRALNLSEYLLTDENVYLNIIKYGEESTDLNYKILALMALRPYTFIKTGMDAYQSVYQEIEKRSTHLAHSMYARSSRVPFKKSKYNKRSMRAYCKKVIKATHIDIDPEKIVPEEWGFDGFNYQKVWALYTSIPTETIFNLRMKAMVFRIVLETSLYMLVSKKTFNPERIGTEYTKAIKGTHGEQNKMCEELDKLYDLSKKYHHGADGGSTLGLSALNPDEMIYFDEEIKKIHDWIVTHTELCNPNAVNY